MSEERFPELTLEAMSTQQRDVVQAMLSGPRGKVHSGSSNVDLGPYNALLRNPEIAQSVQQVGEVLRFRSSLPEALNEFAIILVGRYWSAPFEFSVHSKIALKAGLDSSIVDAIASGQRPVGMSEDETLVYTFVTELLKNGTASDAVFEATKNRFGENGVVELTSICGYYSLISFVLNVAQTPAPGGQPNPLVELLK